MGRSGAWHAGWRRAAAWHVRTEKARGMWHVNCYLLHRSDTICCDIGTFGHAAAHRGPCAQYVPELGQVLGLRRENLYRNNARALGGNIATSQVLSRGRATSRWLLNRRFTRRLNRSGLPCVQRPLTQACQRQEPMLHPTGKLLCRSAVTHREAEGLPAARGRPRHHQ